MAHHEQGRQGSVVTASRSRPETTGVHGGGRSNSGLEATVPGTIGVIGRTVEEGLSEDDAKTIVRRLDEHGLHMTAELRATAIDLIETAAE